MISSSGFIPHILVGLGALSLARPSLGAVAACPANDPAASSSAPATGAVGQSADTASGAMPASSSVAGWRLASTAARAQIQATAITGATPPSGAGTSALVVGSDSCSAPSAIGGLGPFAFDNSTATTGAEGQSNANCLFSGTTGISQDLWFVWQATWSGGAQISLCGLSMLDTKVAVYSGSGCPTNTALVCNDDSFACSTIQSQVCFPAAAGQMYTIQIGNRPGTSAGPGQFTISEVPVPVGCRYDDGSSENSLGWGGDGEILWLHRFGAAGQTTTISAVSTCFGTPALPGFAPPVGTPMRALVWDDPNDDGNPTDAVLLAQVGGTVQHVDVDVFDTYNLAAPTVAGGVFFVGIGIVQTPNQFPAPLDLDGCPLGSFGRAWVCANPGLADANNLGLNALPPTELDALGIPGVWLLRAVDNVPCPALGALGAEVEPQVVSNVVPTRWRAPDVIWSRDVGPHNGIDDEIDALPLAAHDIVVNYRKAVTTADLERLEGLGGASSVQFASQYITSVFMANVTLSEITQMLALSGVAFIEKQFDFTPNLDVSTKAIKVTSGCYSPNTVQDAYPLVDGAGCNIAIVDTGVHDAHLTFAATPYVAGYEVNSSLVVISGNPTDTNGHGTHVASIALGQGVGGVSRGVAKAAGLIEAKCIPGSFAQAAKALEHLYNNHTAWNVKVVNMSFGGGATTDGTDSFSQLVDIGDSMGMVMVAAAGNSGPSNVGLTTPAAASRAITVASANDVNTCTRTDDAISIFSSVGPRANNANYSCIDELKPEVAAPGSNIVAAQAGTTTGSVSLSGTSMAAPHVAGVAALICQHNCAGANPASIKALLIQTAQQFGSSSTSCPSTGVWNTAWGWGLIDAFAAINAAGLTDVTFQTASFSPPWLSPDISVIPPPSASGPISTVSVKLLNTGGVTAFGVHIVFGANVYSASVPTYQHIGTLIANLPPGPSTWSILWDPQVAGHQCLQVDLGYGNDTNCNNNSAHRNYNVAASPVVFEVRNTLTVAPANIQLEVACAEGNLDHWNVCLTPTELTLGGYDPPVEVTVLALPTAAAVHGESIMVHVTARIGAQLLGGVSVMAIKRDCNGNGVDDYLDIADGTSADVDDNHVPDECDSRTFCTGDGVPPHVACPCGNNSAPADEAGCLNSMGIGATLRSSGASLLSADTLTLLGAQMSPTASALYFQGSAPQSGGNGVVFGDGLRCAAGSVVRLETVTNSGGASQYPRPSDPQVSVKGAVTSPGQRFYQVWYRNATPFCTASTFNLTNGLRVVWIP